MDPELAIHLLGGAAELAELTGMGVSRRKLSAALAAGAVTRVRRGCYCLPAADPLVVAEKAWRGRITCVSAAVAWGLPLLSRVDGHHLAVQRGRSFGAEHLTPPPSTVFHHVDAVSTAATPAVALDLAARCTTRDEHVVMVDGALARGLITRADLRGFHACSRARRQFLMRHATGVTQSPLETLTRVALRQARLRFAEQVSISGVGRVDFVVEGRLILELDGREHHREWAQSTEDRRRDRAAAALGYRVVRFTYADVMHRRQGMIDEVRAVLGAPFTP